MLPLWSVNATSMECQCCQYGVSILPLWSVNATIMEFQYYHYGVSMLPLWSVNTAIMEFHALQMEQDKLGEKLSDLHSRTMQDNLIHVYFRNCE